MTLDKLAPALVAALRQHGTAPTLVFLASQADTSAAQTLPTKAEKGQYVYQMLSTHAARTLADLRAYLGARGVAYRPHYLTNMIALPAADAALVAALAARPDVARLDLDATCPAILL